MKIDSMVNFRTVRDAQMEVWTAVHRSSTGNVVSDSSHSAYGSTASYKSGWIWARILARGLKCEDVTCASGAK